MPKTYEEEVLGKCPHCGGRIVRDVTGGIFFLPPIYCENCATLFKFVPELKVKKSSLGIPLDAKNESRSEEVRETVECGLCGASYQPPGPCSYCGGEKR